MLDREISRLGGFWNAFTFLDWTTYFETLPAEAIDVALRLEADRMRHSLFDAQEVESERTVIIAERQGSENEPLFLLGEEVQAAAFRVHSYHHEVIGDLADLHSMQRDDLYQHYRTYYTPGNAVLALAGDFDGGAMLKRLEQLYADIPAGPAVARRNRPEPPQKGERRVSVEGPGETTYIEIAYHAPAATHPDFFPLMAADSLLNGPGNLNMFSEGISNKTSRMYRALIEGELAVSTSGGMQATLDPYLHSTTIIPRPERSVEEVVAAFDAEIERLQETPPTPEELRRAVKQERALFSYGSERITNQAFWLGFAEMIDPGGRWFDQFLERMAAVTPEEVQRAAQIYLQPRNRVLGVYLPDGTAADEEHDAAFDDAAADEAEE